MKNAWLALMTAVRLLTGFLVMGVAVAVQMLVLIVLLPSRNARIRSCNYWGKVVGRVEMWVSGCPTTVTSGERLDANHPAIYISNHTSPMDAFLAMFLSPVGTCGVVKKGIIYYPFFGQMYLLSGHLRIDRKNRQSAIKSMAGLVEDVRRYHLSMFIWPEGTRSRDGRLGPFKKGVVHMALATGLPIVPIVVTGAHRAWQKGSLRLAPVPVDVQVLPPIDTSGWTQETLDTHVYELWDVYRRALPEDQQPATLMELPG